MRHAHLLSCRGHAEIAAPGQPLGAVIETPVEPACALVELADHDEQLVGGRVDARAEVENAVIELVDTSQVRAFHDVSLS
jgi:hypothetical protein